MPEEIRMLEDARTTHLFQMDQAGAFLRNSTTIEEAKGWALDSIRELRNAWRADLELSRMRCC